MKFGKVKRELNTPLQMCGLSFESQSAISGRQPASKRGSFALFRVTQKMSVKELSGKKYAYCKVELEAATKSYKASIKRLIECIDSANLKNNGSLIKSVWTSAKELNVVVNSEHSPYGKTLIQDGTYI